MEKIEDSDNEEANDQKKERTNNQDKLQSQWDEDLEMRMKVRKDNE